MLQKVTSPLGPKPAVLRTASFPSLFHALLLTGLSKTQPVPVYCLQGQNLQLLAPEKGRFGQHWSGPKRQGEEQRSKRGPSAWPGSQLRHLVGAPHPSVKWARQGPALRALDACLCPSSPLQPCPSPPRPCSAGPEPPWPKPSPWCRLSVPAVRGKRGDGRWSCGVRAQPCARCVPHVLQARLCHSTGASDSSLSHRGGRESHVGTTVCGSWWASNIRWMDGWWMERWTGWMTMVGRWTGEER